jgi:hypothetical protein
MRIGVFEQKIHGPIKVLDLHWLMIARIDIIDDPLLLSQF